MSRNDPVSNKNDGTVRFCIDVCKLKIVTLCDTYSLLLMDECINPPVKLNFYHRQCVPWIFVNKYTQARSREISIICHAGTFQWVSMPFGLTNAPDRFRCALDLILNQFKWNNCVKYLDDAIIYYNDVDDRIRNVDQILTTLAEADITLKIKMILLSTTCRIPRPHC